MTKHLQIDADCSSALPPVTDLLTGECSVHLALSIEHDDLLLPCQVVLQVLAHKTVRDENQFLTGKRLADLHVVAAGYADVALGLDLGAGVDVAHDRGTGVHLPEVANVLCGDAVAQ